MGDDARDAAGLNHERLCRRVGEDLQLAGLLSFVDKLAGNGLRARDDETRIGIEQPALDLILLDQREKRLDLRRGYETGPGAEGLARSDLAPDLFHPRVVARAGHFQPADTRVVAHPVEEIGPSRARSRSTGNRGSSCSRSRTRAPSSRYRSGIPDLSMPTMSVQPRSMRWCAIDAPTMPPRPTMTICALSGNADILHPSCMDAGAVQACRRAPSPASIAMEVGTRWPDCVMRASPRRHWPAIFRNRSGAGSRHRPRRVRVDRHPRPDLSAIAG